VKGEIVKTLTKSLVVASIVGTFGLGGLATAGIANAESSTNSSTDPMSSLVEKIASTFNIDKSKVQSLFDENRTEREAARVKQQETELQKLVDAGTITAAQKTAIEAKLAELKKEREADKDTMKDLTDAERKAKMDEKRTELESWAKEQGLDLTKLKGILGGGHGGSGGPGGGI
jgi:membrane protein involved in colicin uptake